MIRHLGYVATSYTIGASTSRTCRLANAAPERLRELIAANLDDLGRVIRFNAENGIQLYRISSDLIPFGSHPVNTIPWWDEFGEPLSGIGAAIRESGQRVSMHPGQFTVLNSPREDVVKSAIAEIAWHVRLLEGLGTDRSSKIVIHVGGAFGDKKAAADRFVRVVGDLPLPFRQRLVIENDERIFSTEDVLKLSSRTGLPMIFDNLHDLIHGDRDDGAGRFLPDVFATWTPPDGPPKVHYSEQADGGRPGQHSDWIDAGRFLRAWKDAPDTAFDVMLECKKKDLALLRLRESINAEVQRPGSGTGPDQ